MWSWWSGANEATEKPIWMRQRGGPSGPLNGNPTPPRTPTPPPPPCPPPTCPHRYEPRRHVEPISTHFNRLRNTRARVSHRCFIHRGTCKHARAHTHTPQCTWTSHTHTHTRRLLNHSVRTCAYIHTTRMYTNPHAHPDTHAHPTHAYKHTLHHIVCALIPTYA